MAKELQTIDFSGGIRAEKIQHNFEALEDQIARERLAVTGHGISSGLDLIINDFTLTITEGSLIGTDGKEVYLDEVQTEIELPRLKQVVEEIYTVQSGGRIVLPNIPYCLHRKETVTSNAFQHGIKIVDYSNAANIIKFVDVQDNVILVDSSKTDTLVKVSYSYTNRRYDTIYIDKNKKIKVLEGTSSSSPSIMIPEDSLYILGYAEINPFADKGNRAKEAELTIKKDLRSLRNIYTDKYNKLYICGIPFDDLQIIHMEQPSDPFENQLWYDNVANKLKVWKILDGIGQWINVNDSSLIPVKEAKIWEPDENPADGSLFLFHFEHDMHLRFIPGCNELDIKIDQGILHIDQFDEVTVEDALNDVALKQRLIDEFGYEESFFQKASSDYENIGIGFRLGSPLDKQCYVEVNVTHRIQENPLFKRFQRSATFSEKNFFRSIQGDKVFKVNGYYRMRECQLDVYADGKLLNKDLDYIEGLVEDYKDENGNAITPAKGTLTQYFSLTIDVPDNTIITYKLSTTVYSYDHIEDVVGDLSKRLDKAEAVSIKASTTAETAKTHLENSLVEINKKISVLEKEVEEHDLFVKKTDKLTTDQLDDTVKSQLVKGIINLVITKNSPVITLDDVHPDDYITVFDMGRTGNNILIRNMVTIDDGGDYIIEEINGTTRLSFKNASTVADGSVLYITGFKLH